MQNVYKIKKSIKIPMILSVFLSLPVFWQATSRHLETNMLLIAGLLIFLFYMITINNIIKKVSIDNGSISVTSLWGTKTAKHDEIKNITAITMGSRQFINITTNNSNLVIANNYANFLNMIVNIKDAFPETCAATNIDTLIDNPVNRKNDTLGAWLTVAILVAINLSNFQL